MRLFTNIKDKNLERVRKILKKRFGPIADEILIEQLVGGASTRSFYRLMLPRMPVNNTGVLMLMEKKFRIEHSDFYQVSELLRKLNLPYPQIFEDFSSDGALYLQDLGNTHICDMVREIPDDVVMIEEFYRQAIDHLIVLQTRAPHYKNGVTAFTRAFDEKKLLWELDFMMKHFAGSFAGFTPDSSQLKVLTQFFNELAQQIAELPRVLCHRDYHSRNLMFWNEKVYIIDFQDARMGPHVYDLVSLLGDSYADLGFTMRHKLMSYYIEKHSEFSEPDSFRLREQYSLVALQRHLKHLGTFGYLDTLGDSSCLQYVPLTIRYLEENLEKFEKIQDAAAVLKILFKKSIDTLKARE